MSHSPDEERRAFAIWLRTGRRRQAAIPVEVKYNHWHDAQNGQFTEAGTGRHDGSSGGGGDFGGGGASGTWNNSSRRERKPTRPSKSQAQKRPLPGGGMVTIAPPKARSEQSPRQTLRRIRANGYDFYVDDANLTKDLQGELNRGDPSLRSRREQRQAGKPDRRPSDDGGHFIAPRFNGPAEAFNHFAQDANFNRGAYRAMENEWDKAQKSGQVVAIRIMAFYKDGSRRPSVIHVSFSIDGHFQDREFNNERQEKIGDK
jgi:hypothetical protein